MSSLLWEKISSKRWVRWFFIFIIWTTIALAFTFQGYLEMQAKGKPMDWGKALTWQMTWWYIWIPLSFLILQLGKRFPIDLKSWHRRLLIHVPCGFAVSALHMVLQACLSWRMMSPDKPPSAIWESVWEEFAGGGFHIGVLTYFVILGIQILGNFYGRVREEKLRASQLETELAYTELQTLRVQLQPQFLFNTLRNISSLLRTDVDEADRMIARLGDFLRLTLQSSGSEEGTLRSELEFLQSYLEIEQIRFHNRLTTRMDIEAKALDTPVPHFLLQPIVENTFLGRMESSANPGQIEIVAKRNNGILQLQIRNDGSWTGMKENSELMETRLRLRQIFGSKYRFEMAKDSKGIQTVTLEIPVDSLLPEPEKV